MSRFDPATYPDRLAFEANARRIRAEEMGKAFDCAIAWLEGRRQKLAGGHGKFSASLAHRHSAR